MTGQKTDRPAQVLRIVWKNPYLLNLHTAPQTFFTIHERFAPKEVVLDSRMHLLSVTGRAAIFTELDCDILNVREHPFYFMAQTNNATRLVILPTKVFYDLVDKIDIRDRKVVWMLHTTRCGSTAWVQAFNSLPGWTVFAEPQAMTYSIMYGEHGYPCAESFSKTAEFKRLAVAVIKMYLRHCPAGGSVFWKTTIYDEYLVDIITESFPQHKMLVAYRDLIPSFSSFYRSFYENEYLRYKTEYVLDHDPLDISWWSQLPNLHIWTNGCDYHLLMKVVNEIGPKSCMEWYCVLWAAKVTAIRQVVNSGRQLKCIKYDKLLEDRRATVADLFNYLELPTEFVDIACESFNFDSQAGVALVSWDTRTTLGGCDWTKDATVVTKCSMILNAFGLPDLQSPLNFPDSV